MDQYQGAEIEEHVVTEHDVTDEAGVQQLKQEICHKALRRQLYIWLRNVGQQDLVRTRPFADVEEDGEME